jgi:AsmA family protein
MRRAIRWASRGLRLLVVGMVGLVAICGWHWCSGSVARQAREALGRTVVIEGALEADGTWPPLIRAEPVQMGVFDWSWIKGYVVRKASEALGRTVVVEGALDVDWSWPPLIRAEQVRVANATWSKEPFMLEIRRLTCRIDLQALLRGRFVLPMVELVEPVVRLETSEQGEANWTVQPTQPVAEDQAHAGALPLIERLSLQDGSVTYADAASNTSMIVTLAKVEATTTGPEQRLDVEGVGQVADLPFRLTGHGGSLQDLTGNKPYPVQVQLIVDQWQGDLNGTVAQPLQLQGVAGEVSLARVFPDQPSGNQGQGAQAAPGQAPYRLTGHLTREGDVWAVRELTGTLGNSDLAGSVSLDVQGKRPWLEAQLFSRTLDVRDLAIPTNASGQPPSPGATATQGEESPPEVVLDLELTRAVNARLHFQGITVVIADQTVHNVSADLVLQDGHLSLRPVLDVAGGTLRAQVEVDDRGEAPLRSAVQADIAHVNVRQVLAAFGMEHQAAGRIDGRVDLATSGRSLPQLLSSLAGKAALRVRDQASHTDFRMTFATEAGTQQAQSRVRLASQGRVRGEPFHLEGHVGSWYGGPQPLPVQMHLRLGETRARLDGTLGQGPQRTGLAAHVAIQGPDPARLSSLLSLSVPSLPAYRFEGRLLHNGSTWTLQELKGSLGDSDLAGELSLDTGGEHLVLHGDVQSQILVVDELTGYQPEKKPGRVEPEKVQVPTPVQDKVQERPQALEATLRFRSAKVIAAKVPLEHFVTDLRLHNGRLALTPRFQLAGGTVQAQVHVDTQATPLHSTLRTEVHQLNVQQFLSWLELRPEDAAKPETPAKPKATTKPEVTAQPETPGKPEIAQQPEAAGKLGTAGKLDGWIDLTGTGHSLADFLASANGNVLLSMAEGQMGTVLTELLGLDVAETIQKALAKEKTYQLRCLVADFAVHNGRMETQMLLIDTTDTKVLGGGFIDLHDKHLGLKLEPKSKDFSLFSAQAPLYIIGPLATPAAGPKLGEVLLSLSMPIKLGTPENADCHAVLQAAQQRYQTSKP